MGRLKIATAPGDVHMDTSKRDLSMSSGRGSMVAPTRWELKWRKRQEKEEIKKRGIEEDEREFHVGRSEGV